MINSPEFDETDASSILTYEDQDPSGALPGHSPFRGFKESVLSLKRGVPEARMVY